MTYFIHCADPASPWKKIEPAVKAYPLCSGAEVEFIKPSGEIDRSFKLPTP